MPKEYGFIRETLERFEGKGKTQGYIPRDSQGVILGVSGVTVGTGVDLGQQTAAGLVRMGVPQSLVSALMPYLGLRKEEAAAALAQRPLSLSEEQTALLDDLVARSYTRDTEARFNRLAARASAGPDYRFADRPAEVQAVAVSLEYQLGPSGAARYTAPLAAGDYHAAIAALRSARAYAARRGAEADLLARAVKRLEAA